MASAPQYVINAYFNGETYNCPTSGFLFRDTDNIRFLLNEKANFPWAASGRALAMGRDDGVTKLRWDPATKRIIGAGIVGVNAGELLAETVLAMEMGADLEDLALTVHAHPTLSETPMFAAEMGLGVITDLYVPKKK